MLGDQPDVAAEGGGLAGRPWSQPVTTLGVTDAGVADDDSPVSKVVSAFRQRKSVLLPEPDGPMMQRTSPTSMSRETPSSTRAWPYDLETLRTRISAGADFGNCVNCTTIRRPLWYEEAVKAAGSRARAPSEPTYDPAASPPRNGVRAHSAPRIEARSARGTKSSPPAATG